MSNAAIGEAFISAVWYFVCFLIGVAICRWAFRINDIVSRLDKLISLADPTASPEATKGPIDDGRPVPHFGGRSKAHMKKKDAEPQEVVKVTLSEPYIPNANRLPRQD